MKIELSTSYLQDGWMAWLYVVWTIFDPYELCCNISLACVWLTGWTIFDSYAVIFIWLVRQPYVCHCHCGLCKHQVLLSCEQQV